MQHRKEGEEHRKRGRGWEGRVGEGRGQGTGGIGKGVERGSERKHRKHHYPLSYLDQVPPELPWLCPMGFQYSDLFPPIARVYFPVSDITNYPLLTASHRMPNRQKPNIPFCKQEIKIVRGSRINSMSKNIPSNYLHYRANELKKSKINLKQFYSRNIKIGLTSFQDTFST